MWRSRPSRLPAGQGYRTRSCKGWCHPGECILRPEYSLHDSNVNVTFWQVNHEDWPRTSALDPFLPVVTGSFRARHLPLFVVRVNETELIGIVGCSGIHVISGN